MSSIALCIPTKPVLASLHSQSPEQRCRIEPQHRRVSNYRSLPAGKPIVTPPRPLKQPSTRLPVMAPDGQHSNIRVFVHWRDQTVFAGEDIKCTITFKNVAREADGPKGGQSHHASQRRNNSDRQRLLSNLASPLSGGRSSRGSNSITSPPPASNGRGHRRSALSLSIPSTTSSTRSAAVQWPSGGGSFADSRPGHSHKRSLSIVSIGSASTIDEHNQRSEPAGRPPMPPRGHNRASSLQIMSKGNTGAGPQPGKWFESTLRYMC